MLSLANVGSSSVAVTYYEETDDYYMSDQSPSEWCGHGANFLGLVGPVDSGQFAELLAGELPTGDMLHNAAAGRRGGTDATFSAPKSVSLQAMVGGDTRLLGAHQRAVDQALVYAEALAACRVTIGRETHSKQTGNLVIARFEHDLSRACDPQLHTHCVIVNATRRPDGQWRALNNEALYRNKMLLGVLYRSALARELQTLGYKVRVTHLDGRFELAHINDKQVRAFSQRSSAIEGYLKDQGRSRADVGAWIKKLAAVATRARKTDVDRALLRREWNKLSQEYGIDYTHPQALKSRTVNQLAVHAVLKESVAHLAERESVFSRADLLRVALERGVGVVTLVELEAALEAGISDGELIRNEDRYTTVQAQLREAEILSIEAAGRDALEPIYKGDRAELLAKIRGLKEEQKFAAIALLETRNQIMGIQGRAGVGKTTLLTTTRDLVVAAGYQVKGLAPSASSARELASTGMHAETIATFSLRKTKGLTSKTLLVVDEAGMASTKQLHDILLAAKKACCRVLLVGDVGQLGAVEAGKPYAQLQHAGMAIAQINQIQRQTNANLKRAVEHAADGEINLAVELLKKHVSQIVSASDRFERIAADYVALTQAERKDTRVIAGTRYARSEINKRIRNNLGLGDGQVVTLLTRKDLTEAGRRSTLSYDVGDIVQTEVDYPSLQMKQGEFATVVDRQGHKILLQHEGGLQLAWQPATMTRMAVFTPEQRPLAIGDLVRVTANDRAKGLVNGDLAKVIAIEQSGLRMTIKFADGREDYIDSSKPLMLDYGYCTTVYSAQGQTCTRVMIEADAHSMTSNQKTFYVAISRARLIANIYTDDLEMLPVAMAREYEKSSALDLCPNQFNAFELASLA